MKQRVLVFAPHPDDEVLGVGGTIARLARTHHQVFVVITSRATEPMFKPEIVERGRREAKSAHELLGVHETRFLDEFPAALLDTVPQADLNHALAEVVAEVRPNLLFIPFLGDIHNDHQRVFQSALVASRPNTPFAPSKIYAYETLSETNWNAPYVTPPFVPNVYIDISDTLELKLEAMRTYASQLRDFPNERSIESLRALATLRGSTVGLRAAEGFVLLREINRL